MQPRAASFPALAGLLAMLPPTPTPTPSQRSPGPDPSPQGRGSLFYGGCNLAGGLDLVSLWGGAELRSASLTPEQHMHQPAWCVALVRLQGASRAQAGPCIVERGRGKWLMEAARLCSQFSDDRRQTPEEQCWGWGHIAPSGNPAPAPRRHLSQGHRLSSLL